MGEVHLHSIFIQLWLLLILWTGVCHPIEADETSDISWYLPRPVQGFRSYMDVYPIRFDIPRGLSKVLWTFQTSQNSHSCDGNTIHILVQHSGLPLIFQSNLTYPADFVETNQATVYFPMKPSQLITVALLRPPMGSWYALAYTNGVNQDIRQKGLTSSDECLMSYMSQIEMGSPLTKQEVFMNQDYTINVGPEGSLISFMVSHTVYAFKVTVTQCKSDNDSCSIKIKYRPFNLGEAEAITCTDVASESCTLHVPSPPYLDEQLIAFQPDNDTTHIIAYRITPLECATLENLSETDKCLALPILGRLNTVQPFYASFGYLVAQTTMSLLIPLGLANTTMVPFETKEPNDVGSTLSWAMKDGNTSQSILSIMNIQVCGVIIYNHLPDLSEEFDVCNNATNPVKILITASSKNESKVYVPYPRIGNWHLILQATCFSLNQTQLSCPDGLRVSMSLNIKPCKDDGCEGRGQCLSKSAGSDIISMASCKCAAGFQGYACTDGSHALSDSVQLAGALLLTLSNLFFIPSIIVAVRRKFYLEAFVYFYTMLFSTFYHACDGDRIDRYRECIIRFDVLQSGDFFGSSCSLWFTLVAMAQIRIRWVTPLLQILGPFSLIIGVIYDKTSLYVIAVPTGCGLLIIICSWAQKMYQRKKFYPSWKRYLFFLLPGVALAGTGAALFAFVETEENYKYVHSAWHVSIALSICLLLPPKNMKGPGHCIPTPSQLPEEHPVEHLCSVQTSNNLARSLTGTHSDLNRMSERWKHRSHSSRTDYSDLYFSDCENESMNDKQKDSSTRV